MTPANAPPFYLQAWREHASLTQDELAERSGYSKTHISQLESGAREWNGRVLRRLAEVLDCHPSDFITRNPLDPSSPWAVWERIPLVVRPQALRVLETFASPAGTDASPTADQRKA